MGGLTELTTHMLAHFTRCKCLFLSILLILCALSGLQAQTQWQRDTLALIPGDTTYLSQKFLVPFSQSLISTTGDTLSTEMYQMEYAAGWIRLASGSGSRTLYARLSLLSPKASNPAFRFGTFASLEILQEKMKWWMPFLRRKWKATTSFGKRIVFEKVGVSHGD